MESEEEAKMKEVKVEDVVNEVGLEMPGKVVVDVSKMKLAIATPFYEVKAYSPYITSLITSVNVLKQLNIEFDYWELPGDSYVDRAKNTLVHRFMHTDHTHLLMIDSDLAWDLDGFIRLIKAALMGAEVVGGVYPNKNNWATFGAIPVLKNGKPIYRESGGTKLIEMQGIPGGFLIYSKAAFERTKPNLNVYIEQNVPEQFYEYFRLKVNESPFIAHNDTVERHIRRSFEMAMGEFMNYAEKAQNLDGFVECFRCVIEKNGRRTGEDIYFQQRYREMGGTVWCEPNINITHFGVKGWGGNYAEYLESHPAGEAKEEDRTDDTESYSRMPL